MSRQPNAGAGRRRDPCACAAPIRVMAAALLYLMAFSIVLLEQVRAEIAAEIAPHRVNVIGIILRVVEFNQEVWRLNAIIVRIATADAA